MVVGAVGVTVPVGMPPLGAQAPPVAASENEAPFALPMASHAPARVTWGVPPQALSVKRVGALHDAPVGAPHPHDVHERVSAADS